MTTNWPDGTLRSAAAELGGAMRLRALLRLLPLIAACQVLLFASCGFAPEKVSWSDPRLAPMLKAIAAVDRASLGFTPITPTSSVRLELRSGGGYDAMLHIAGATYRTVAFRKTPEGYQWIHEQESHSGPKTYETADGTLQERISVTYGLAPISGHAPNQLHIVYWGKDPRLPAHRPLTLEQVRPIIAEWEKGR